MRPDSPVFLLVLVFALAGCGNQVAVADKGKPAPVADSVKPATAADKDQPLAGTDKDIYQALLDYISANISSERKVVFSEQAVKVEDVFRPPGPVARDASAKKPADKTTPVTQLQALLPAIPSQLATNFIEKLQAAGNIGEADIPSSTRIKPVFVSDADLIAIFVKDTDGWQRFHDKFNGVKSLVKLSRPAIDPESDLAIVYLGVYCGAACGEGDLYLIGKLKGKWVVVHKQRMWVNHN